MKRRSSLLDKVDGALFAFAGASAVWLAYLLFKEGIRPGGQLLLLIPFWVVVAAGSRRQRCADEATFRLP
jgi:hypothetical protein